ncbi:MAG: hypothetical protein JWO38_4846 [Gemmataceae bacterium]|nr:hypothetical protein [Gemmataceae bacterium]
MEMKVDRVPATEFVGLWNTANSLDAVVERVRQLVGPIPRWAVIARAAAIRKGGTELKRFPAANLGGEPGPQP